MYHPLSNIEIENLLSAHPATKDIYKGFLYPRDTKTPKISPPALYVVNTDYAKGPGIHWILIYYLKDKTVFFDPFGLSPDTHNFPFVRVDRKFSAHWKDGSQHMNRYFFVYVIKHIYQ